MYILEVNCFCAHVSTAPSFVICEEVTWLAVPLEENRLDAF